MSKLAEGGDEAMISAADDQSADQRSAVLGSHPGLSPSVAAQVQHILDGAARRILTGSNIRAEGGVVNRAA